MKNFLITLGRHFSFHLGSLGIASVLLALAGCHSSGVFTSEKLFRALNADESGVRFSNMLHEAPDLNIIKYLYYYNGGGVAVGDVNQDGKPDLFFTANQSANQLYLNEGNLHFKDATAAAGIVSNGGWSTGVTMADVNGDGALDIYVCQVGNYLSLKGHNLLYINDGKGHFSEESATYGLDFRGFSTQAAFFDYDRDGDLDVYLLNHSVHAPENYGDASIREKRDSLSGDRLYRNDGQHFTDISPQAGIFGSRIGYGLGVGVGDLNNDSWPDLYISNDFHENDYVYFNQGNGKFRENIRGTLGHSSTFSMGNDIGDYNNDGWLDLITLDMKPDDETVLKSSAGADPYNIYQFKVNFGYYHQYPRNMLQLNQGNLQGTTAQFSEIGQMAGVAATDWSWAPLFCDLDNDGWKDLFIANGIWRRPNDLDYLKYISNQQVQSGAADLDLAAKMPSGQVANCAFQNKKDLTFTKVSNEWGLDRVGCSNGAAYADLDQDGDLDLITNNLNGLASVMENRSRTQVKNNYLQIKLIGKGGNTQALGARIVAKTGDLQQTYEVFATRGFQSAVESVAHFGLGDLPQVDTLEIRWPDGHGQIIKNVKANQRLVIKETDPYTQASLDFNPFSPPFFREVTQAHNLKFTHDEKPLTDFDVEQLLPHGWSVQGPALNIADIDGNGLADILVGNDVQSTFYQNNDGSFRQVMHGFAQPMAGGYAAATVFDVNGDFIQDKILAPTAPPNADIQTTTTLQIAYGLGGQKGGFQPAPSKITVKGIVGVLYPLDFNLDGAVDLFVGGRCLPGSYGVNPPSYLFQNDGRGNFTDVTAKIAPELSSLGMVTAVQMLTQGGPPKLVIVGEWMPVTFFTISPTRWVKTTLPNSQGWWNTVRIADMDSDGDEDLLLGNLGLNTDLQASKEQPVELFVGDFDQNLRMDPILTYYKQNKRYIYFSKDELAGQLPSLRRKFLEYRPFAETTFEGVFAEADLKGATHQVAYTFASAIAINQGNGNFELTHLPLAAQTSPIADFAVTDVNGDGKKDLIAVGNFYENRPAIGRCDASFGWVMLGDERGHFSVVPARKSGFIIPGQARHIASLRDPQGRSLFIVARNNAPGMVFELNR